jgi:hypothetical protein
MGHFSTPDFGRLDGNPENPLIPKIRVRTVE